MCIVVVVMVRVEGCFLGYRAIACLCLCQSVELSLFVFTRIRYNGCVRRVLGFRRYFRLVGSVGRSWRSLMIFEEVVDVEVGRSGCRDRQ